MYTTKEIQHMRFSVLQQDLHRGLGIVNRAVPGRTTRPILTNICVAAEGGRLRLFATDEEMGIVSWIEAVVHEEGATAIPARLLCDFVGSLQPGQLEFTATADQNDVHAIRVRSQRGVANIRGFDPAEFPLVPGADGGEPPVQLEAATLKEMIGAVIEAAGDDVQHPVFTGVLVQVRGRQLTLVAADRQRLALRRDTLGSDAGERQDIIIPAQTLSDLTRILPAQGRVVMAVTARRSQVIFTTDQLQLSSRLIEGKFPDYTQILPREHATLAVVGTATLASLVREVWPFAEGGKDVVVLSLKGGAGESLDPGQLVLEASAQDLGDTTRHISATVDGPDQQIIYDIRHVRDALDVIRTPEVAIELTSEARPGVIRPVGGVEFVTVITPFTRNAAQPSASAEAAAAS
jgi:DNA polymerase III subunit beta